MDPKGSFVKPHISFKGLTFDLLFGNYIITVKGVRNAPSVSFRDYLFGTFVFISCICVTYAQFKTEVDQFDFFMAVPIALIAGFAWILFGTWLTRWQITRCIGLSLLSRVNLITNWIFHPVRSFSEFGWWLGTIWGSSVVYDSTLVAIQLGNFCGLSMVIIGDYFLPKIQAFLEVSTETSTNQRSTNAVSASLVLGTLGFEIIKIVYVTHINLILAIVIPTFAGIGIGLAGELCLTWGPTRGCGITIVQRVLQAPKNWIHRPSRSCFETSLWLTAVYGSYILYGDLFTAIRLGTIVGILVILSNSWVLCNFFISDELNVLEEAAKMIFAEKKLNLDAHLSFEEWQAADQCSKLCSQINRSTLNTKTKEWTPEEISLHNTKTNCWISIDTDVYDVSDWIEKHPGGGDIILRFAGQDVTDQFYAFHPHQASNLRKYLKFFRVGKLNKSYASEYTKDYRDLRRYLWANGYFKPLASYFVWKHILLFAIAVCMFTLLFFANMTTSSSHSCSIFFTVVAALALSLTWQQSAFLGHDCLHIGVVKSSEANHFLGWIHASCIFGISSQKWLVEHSIHHACTLRPTQDPQFDYLPMWLQHAKEISVSNCFTDDGKLKSWWMSVLISLQHITFLPLPMILGRFALVIESIFYAWKHSAWMDMLGMSFFWVTYFGILFQFVPSSIMHKIIFVLVSHFGIGFLHVQLLVSHLSTTMFTVEEEIEAQFFKTQLATSRNIETNQWSRWLHGGLEQQIEHHLFPLMPRHNITKVVPFVRALCAKHSIPYQSCSFWQSIVICTKDLKQTAKALLYPDLG